MKGCKEMIGKILKVIERYDNMAVDDNLDISCLAFETIERIREIVKK